MTTSLHAWHDHLDGSSMEGIEEGLLDETDKTILKFHQTSTAFPRATDHGWKELVSDPSLSEVEVSENIKTQQNTAGIGRKDWDHYLSAFSLNDEDTGTKFVPLEVHTDHGQEDLGISARVDFKEQKKEHFDTGNKSATGVIQGVENVTLPVVSKMAGKKNIENQRDLNQEMIEQGSFSRSSSHVLEDASFPAKSKLNSTPSKFALSTNEYSPDGGNFYEKSKNIVRPGSAPTIPGRGVNIQPGLTLHIEINRFYLNEHLII